MNPSLGLGLKSRTAATMSENVTELQQRNISAAVIPGVSRKLNHLQTGFAPCVISVFQCVTML